MAHLHQVPEEEVLRLGWPYWLHLATDDALLLDESWTPQGTISTLTSTCRPAPPPRSYLAVTGPVLDAQIKQAFAALASPRRPPARDGHLIDPHALTWAEARIRALEAMETGTLLDLSALYAAARAEHQLVTALMTSSGYDHATGVRLLLLSARTAALCGWISTALGESAAAERYVLAALRAASAAGAHQDVAACLYRLAVIHFATGNPMDALSVARAAQAIVPKTQPFFVASLHIKEAVTLARLGEATAGAKRLGQAIAQAARGADQDAGSTALDVIVNEGSLDIAQGIAWHSLGRPERALAHFAALTGDGPPSSGITVPSPYTAGRLLYAVDAQLSLGDLEAAAHHTRHAIAVTGTLPPGLAQRFRQRLVLHAAEPAVRELYDLLSEKTPS
ncbi:hypothetical protein AB0C81_18280 [Streptomyces roseoverticillatus]|uniref:hypothetical protein n=1 Tax=Streptomyces roseoverticillatus TaxID=66429 RepID=UPI0033FD509E